MVQLMFMQTKVRGHLFDMLDCHLFTKPGFKLQQLFVIHILEPIQPLLLHGF